MTMNNEKKELRLHTDQPETDEDDGIIELTEISPQISDDENEASELHEELELELDSDLIELEAVQEDNDQDESIITLDDLSSEDQGGDHVVLELSDHDIANSSDTPVEDLDDNHDNLIELNEIALENSSANDSDHSPNDAATESPHPKDEDILNLADIVTEIQGEESANDSPEDEPAKIDHKDDETVLELEDLAREVEGDGEEVLPLSDIAEDLSQDDEALESAEEELATDTLDLESEIITSEKDQESFSMDATMDEGDDNDLDNLAEFQDEPQVVDIETEKKANDTPDFLEENTVRPDLDMEPQAVSAESDGVLPADQEIFSLETKDNDLQTASDTQELPIPEIPPAQIEAVIEKVIQEKYAPKIEQMLLEAIESTVSKEIERIKKLFNEGA